LNYKVTKDKKNNSNNDCEETLMDIKHMIDDIL